MSTPIGDLTPAEIELGTTPNDDTGDELRTGGATINQNFDRAYVLGNVIQQNTIQLFKAIGNTNFKTVEQNDLIAGWWSSTRFLTAARFNGGDTADLNNYTIISEVEF